MAAGTKSNACQYIYFFLFVCGKEPGNGSGKGMIKNQDETLPIPNMGAKAPLKSIM